jgi:hypothetical protein
VMIAIAFVACGTWGTGDIFHRPPAGGRVLLDSYECVAHACRIGVDSDNFAA